MDDQYQELPLKKVPQLYLTRNNGTPGSAILLEAPNENIGQIVWVSVSQEPRDASSIRVTPETFADMREAVKKGKDGARGSWLAFAALDLLDVFVEYDRRRGRVIVDPYSAVVFMRERALLEAA